MELTEPGIQRLGAPGLRKAPMPANAISPTRRLVSVDDAAEQLQVNPKTIRRYVAAGRLPAYRTGPRLIRVCQDDVDALLQRIPSPRVVA